MKEVFSSLVEFRGVTNEQLFVGYASHATNINWPSKELNEIIFEKFPSEIGLTYLFSCVSLHRPDIRPYNSKNFTSYPILLYSSFSVQNVQYCICKQSCVVGIYLRQFLFLTIGKHTPVLSVVNDIRYDRLVNTFQNFLLLFSFIDHCGNLNFCITKNCTIGTYKALTKDLSQVSVECNSQYHQYH